MLSIIYAVGCAMVLIKELVTTTVVCRGRLFVNEFERGVELEFERGVELERRLGPFFP